MTRKRFAFVGFIILMSIGGVFVWNLTARAAYESAEYTVVEKEGSFEIRDYPDLMLASTEMDFESQGRDGSFMRLFRYISGGNESNQKVSMTTPVFMDGTEEAKGQMGFVIPKEVVIAGVPEPASSDVSIRKREGGRFAVIRFSGRLNAKKAKDAEQKLRKWIEAKGLKGQTESESAGYDPPFTPGPLRRNEILVRLSDVEESAPRR